ncbi:MAG: CbiQ family ECF transporter T component [Angustibacter sp.]
MSRRPRGDDPSAGRWRSSDGPWGLLIPRLLHPAAWWLWAAGLATAASRTTNPWVLLLVVTVAGFVVASRRELGSLSPFGAFLRLGLLVVAARLLLQALLGGGPPGRTVLVRLPEIPLPEAAAGVRLAGPVTLEELLAAGYDGARLAAVLACVGAANTLASPRRMLRYLPATLYEVGTALVVALTYAPQLVEDARRVRAARRLRGHGGRGPREVGRLLMPVLDGALERSLELAASMESRGYGRRPHRDPVSRRRSTALTLTGVGGVVVGTYGMLDSGSPPLLGLPLVAAGTLCSAAALVVGARTNPRSRYRPDPWGAPEWWVTGSGVVAATLTVTAARLGEAGLVPQTSPAAWPTLPWLSAIGVLVAIAPAWWTPEPPRRAARRAATRLAETTRRGSTMPSPTVPSPTAPGDTVPSPTAPGDTVPSPTAPGPTAPGPTRFPAGRTAPADALPLLPGGAP